MDIISKNEFKTLFQIYNKYNFQENDLSVMTGGSTIINFDKFQMNYEDNQFMKNLSEKYGGMVGTFIGKINNMFKSNNETPTSTMKPEIKKKYDESVKTIFLGKTNTSTTDPKSPTASPKPSFFTKKPSFFTKKPSFFTKKPSTINNKSLSNTPTFSETSVSNIFVSQPNSKVNDKVFSATSSEMPNNDRVFSATSSEMPNNDKVFSATSSEMPNNDKVFSATSSEMPNNDKVFSATSSEMPNSKVNDKVFSATSSEMPKNESLIYSKTPNNNISNSDDVYESTTTTDTRTITTTQQIIKNIKDLSEKIAVNKL